MAAMEAKIRGYAAEDIDKFAGRGECEAMTELAFRFPIKVFMELMGLPADRVAEFLEWENGLIHGEDENALRTATEKVEDYLIGEIEDRRARPRDDLLTFAAHAEKEGKKLTDDEVIGFAFNLFAGGLDTVSATLGLHLLHLATHPDHQALLRADPSKIPNAIEEMMRAYGAVTTFRTCKKAVTLHGVEIMPGDKVVMSTVLAGRDPEAFPNPATVDLNRKPRQMGFGFGIHLCLGMHLARRELRIALEEFLARVPEFHLAEGHSLRWHLGIVKPAELPLRWARS